MKNQTTTFGSGALSRIIKATFTAGLVPTLVLLFGIHASQAGSATWKSGPPSNDWSSAANWSPMTVPNGPSDVARFATSSVTGISLAAVDEVSRIVFPAGASSYTITDMIDTLTISGAGVRNNSGATQNFVAQPLRQVGGGTNAVISFINQASAGDATYSIMGRSSSLYRWEQRNLTIMPPRPTRPSSTTPVSGMAGARPSAMRAPRPTRPSSTMLLHLWYWL